MCVVQGISTYLWASMGIQLDLDSHQSVDGRSQQEGSGSPTLNQHMAESASAAATGFGFGANIAAFDSGASGAASGRPVELWSETVLRLTLSVPETGAKGVLYIDPGGGYGARQLHFGSSSGGRHPSAGNAVSQQQVSLPVDLPAVSLGLMWRWPGGKPDGLPALWELLHELGHGVHLLLSSQRQPPSPPQFDTSKETRSGRSNAVMPDGNSDGKISSSGGFKHFGGLHLPLDMLEVPSTFMEKLAMHPATLQVSSRAGFGWTACLLWASAHRTTEPTVRLNPQLIFGGGKGLEASGIHTEVGASGPQGAVPQGQGPPILSWEAACQLAELYRASHYSALDFQEQVRGGRAGEGQVVERTGVATPQLPHVFGSPAAVFDPTRSPPASLS